MNSPIIKTKPKKRMSYATRVRLEAIVGLLIGGLIGCLIVSTILGYVACDANEPIHQCFARLT
jgi:hypothetical protein